MSESENSTLAPHLIDLFNENAVLILHRRPEREKYLSQEEEVK